MLFYLYMSKYFSSRRCTFYSYWWLTSFTTENETNEVVEIDVDSIYKINEVKASKIVDNTLTLIELLKTQ